jgi:molybdate transport system regulatory protein
MRFRPRIRLLKGILGKIRRSGHLHHCRRPSATGNLCGLESFSKNTRDLNRGGWHNAGMTRLRVSIVFESGARIGPGKVRLLESVRDTGSISAAARDMGMSYKRAWLLLDSTNQAFIEAVVTAAPGGSGGGGATLTPFGVEVLERYRRIHERASKIGADDVAALGRHARPASGPKI